MLMSYVPKSRGQVNFPFELAEDALGHPFHTGPTFSWAGDPSSLRDLVDAVRRGHSVDWAEVHRKAGQRLPEALSDHRSRQRSQRHGSRTLQIPPQGAATCAAAVPIL